MCEKKEIPWEGFILVTKLGREKKGGLGKEKRGG